MLHATDKILHTVTKTQVSQKRGVAAARQVGSQEGHSRKILEVK